MIRLIFVLLVLLLCFLCSCSNRKAENEKQEIITKVTTPEVQAVAREAVYTYNQKNHFQKEIRLTLSAEPIAFNESFIKLSGIVSGKKPIACIEINGKGNLFFVGDSLEKYFVKTIGVKEVLLCLKK